SLVDLLGLAVVVPVIGLVINPNLIAEHALLSQAYATATDWGIADERGFLVALCIFLVGAFLFKTVFGLVVNHVQTRFGFRVAHRMSGDLWMHHFSTSLEKMRSKESGRVLEEINGWPILFARVFITGGQLYFNEWVVIALLAIGLTAYDPIVFIGVASVIVTGGLIIRWGTKRRLQRNSQTIRTLAPRSTTLVSNAVQGFLELITFRAVRNVQQTFLQNTRRLYRVHSNQMVLGIAPARLYEFLAVTALCGMIVFRLYSGQQETAFFEMLSLMALSAYRVMPSMARINARMIAMRGQLHLLEAMESGTGGSYPLVESSESLGTGPLGISVRNLTLAYSDGEPVLTGLSVEFKPGQIHAITGPSGSGKSTLVSALLGLHPASAGEIRVGSEGRILGRDLSVQDWLGSVAYLSQQPFLFRGTVRENLTLGDAKASLDVPLAVGLIDRLGLKETLGAAPLEFELNEGGSNLSGGQQQRLALIRALLLGRPVLVLDEATSGLDGAMRDVVMEVLEEEA
ncbi:MAG: ABC transporter ATP-binding protein, partial [Flavobacteriales bacterium]|nr:ABC transporter ATP-binding protein [Flavobacteriales bacterium]